GSPIFMQTAALPPREGDGVMITTDSRTDGRLMAAFLDRKDEEAFEVLVRRHEALVLNVCARVLRDEHGARDAAQAVFLVLAREAAAHGAGWGFARAAARAAAGGAVPNSVLLLTKGALNMMLMAKIKAAAVAIVAAGAFLAANSVLFPRGSAASDSPLEAAIPIAAARAEVPPLVEVPITFEAFEP